MKRHGSMNHIFRLVWSHVQHSWIAVAETTRGRGKGSSRKLVASALSLTAIASLASVDAQAGPTGGQVVSGSGVVSQSGLTTTITQSSQNLSLNWSSFNIGSQETVNFVQPSANAVAVNHILSNNGTQILGNLNANGQVFLINPNGILFGKGAQVNVGGLVASTLDVSDSSLNSSSRSFSGSGTGSVTNEGTITANNGGYVALLGNHVSNQGVITAQLGAVALGAGSAVTLTFNGNSLLHLQVDQSVLNSLAQNGGLIQADGGQVIMTAGAKDSLLASVVNNTGVIEARTVEEHDGTITLLGGMAAGTVNVGGTLDASAPNGGNGGAIETSAASVKVANGATVTTAAPQGTAGNWLIDPTDFTIAPSGGDITGSQLSTNLGTGNVTILSTSGASGTSGNVNVNDTVTWSANTLTLNAQNNINFNSSVTGSGTAKLALQYGQDAVAAGNTSTYTFNNGAQVNLEAGSNFSTLLGSNGTTTNYTVITSLGAAGSTTKTDLQGINGGLTGDYVLGANIDATATSGWNSGAGFSPIANSSTYFTGIFDGLGHVINNLTVAPAAGHVGGLFGISKGVVQNVGLTNVSVITKSNDAGGLIAANYGTVFNSYATGSVSSNYLAGGLVGVNKGGSVGNSYSAVNVSGPSTTGGLVGYNVGTATITNSYATGNVNGTGSGAFGDLVGENHGSTISNSYATGSVSGASGVGIAGGLVGSNYGSIINSHATGNVSGGATVGGLVGENSGGSINNSYAIGNVSGGSAGLLVGGFAGENVVSGVITNSYATGSVTGVNQTGGFVGLINSATISNSYTSSNVTTTGGTATGGFAGGMTGGTINNVYATGSVSGALETGGLVGISTIGTILNSHATGNVSGTDAIGGLVGESTESGGVMPTISGSYATGNVTASQPNAGGLVGINQGGYIMNSYATGSVSGTGDVGGLVGRSGIVSTFYSTISNSYATGNVTGSGNYVGGLVGNNYGSTVAKSYATGNVVGSGSVTGGLVGANYGGTSSYPSDINNSYATGGVSGVTYVGGLVGYNTRSTVSNSYAVGSVSATGAHVGGLLGGSVVTSSLGTISNSFWDTTTSGQLTSAGGTGMTNAQMQTEANFTSATAANGNVNPGWDFVGTWTMYNGETYPLLQGFLTPLTVTANNATVTYNSTAYANPSGVTYSVTPNANLLGTVSYTSGGAPVVNAGTYTITPGGLYSNQQGYIISYASGTLTVNPATLTVTGETAANKVYNGNTTATLSGGSLSGVYAGDTVTLTQAGSFASKNVGTGITVTASDSISGASAGNYVLTQPTGLAANITPATLTVTGQSAANKVYDGTTSATLSGGSLSGVVAGDTVTLTQAGSFNSKNAGTAVGVTASDSIGGSGASNYTLAQPTGLTANITPATLTVTGESAANKVYDGTTTATLSGGSLSGVVAGDTVTLTQAGSFSTKNVGTGITVTASDSIGGSGASNYTLAQPTGLTANITPATLTVTGESAANKVYDGTTTATLSGGSLSGVVAGDTVTLTQAGSFSTKNVGTGITVTASDSIGGTGASNYVLAQPTGLTANITPATLTVTGESAANKVYDGTTTATLSGGSLSGVVAGDTVSLTEAGNFATKNVGTGITVTASDSIGGTGASNYVLAQPTGLTANITPATLTVTGESAANKVYDGTTTATLSGGSLSGVVAGDTVSLTEAGNFATKNVGTGITVTASDSIGGTGASNYVLAQPTGLTANITPATLTVTGETAANKVYDGTTTATLSGGSLNGVVAGDTVTLTEAGNFVSPNVGNNIAVIAADSIQGISSGNYTLTQPAGLQANITP